MRSVNVTLWQNLGTSAFGQSQVISGQVVDLADKTQEVDGTNKLTKVTPGELTCKVLDPDGSIWAFIQSQLWAVPLWTASTAFTAGSQVLNGGIVYQCILGGTSAASGGPTGLGAVTDGSVTWAYAPSTPNSVAPWTAATATTVGTSVNNGGYCYSCTQAGTTGSGGPAGTGTGILDGTVIWANTVLPALFPPWLQLIVGGTVEFTGLVDLARCKQNASAGELSLELSAIDWSMDLASSYLGSPTALPWQPNTPYMVGQQVLNGGSVYQCSVGSLLVTAGAFVPGQSYAIVSVGTTSFTGIGASANTVGVNFVATGAGAGTGTANGVSSAMGGPAGAVPGIDGSISWVYVPNEWQRPVPLAAAQSVVLSTGIMGTVQNALPFFNNANAQPANTVNLLDPCSWVYPGAYIKLTSGTYISSFGFGSVPFPARPVLIVAADPTGTNPFGYWPPATVAYAPISNTWAQVSNDAASWNSVSHATVMGLPDQTNYFTVLTVNDNAYPPGVTGSILNPNPNTSCIVTLGSIPWPQLQTGAGHIDNTWAHIGGQWLGFFSLVDASASELEYWLTTVAIPTDPVSPCHTLCLNSVEGIVVGDSIGTANGVATGTWVVAGVDPTLNQVSTVEAITDVPLGSQIYWAEASINEWVMEDARGVLYAAIAPYTADLTKFVQPVVADAMFGWVALRSFPNSGASTSAPLYAIGALEPTLTSVKLQQAGMWTNPTTGVQINSNSWTGALQADGSYAWATPVAAPYAPNADWTCQMVSAPASLMPDTIWATNAFQRMPNRCYNDYQYRRENNGIFDFMVGSTTYFVNGVYVGTTYVPGQTSTVYQYTQNGVTYNTTIPYSGFSLTPWSASWANGAAQFTLNDCVGMRRLIFNYGSALFSNAGVVQITPWTGSAWGSSTTWAWPGSTYCQSASLMINPPGPTYTAVPTGSVLVYGTTVVSFDLSSDNIALNNDRLEMWDGVHGTIYASFVVPPALLNGSLVTTPYGTFLVSGSCIGQIVYNGTSALQVSTLYLANVVTNLFANTLVARSVNELVVFGRYDTPGANSTTETWMFRLQAPLASAGTTNEVIWSELVAQGAPPLIGAMRDPGKPGRIMGHFGGSLWQVDTQRSWCIDRFVPGGMTNMELVEHICQLYNALAIPDATGTMHIVSRVQTDTPIGLTVNKVRTAQTRSWTDFASIIRATSQDSKFYFDAYGQQGGVLLEIGSHPLCFSLSGCAGLVESLVQWFGVPRYLNEETWFYADANTAAPWEGVQLYSKLAINGGPSVRLMKMSQNFVTGETTVKTVTA